MFVLPLLVLYIVLFVTLFSTFERVNVEDDNDLYSDVGRKAIVVLGAGVVMLLTALVGWAAASLIHDGVAELYVGGVAVLLTPRILGNLVAGFAKREIDQKGASRARLAKNWLGVGFIHGTWAFPIALVLYLAFS